MITSRTVRWGILATGGIAKSFGRDLSVDPNTRNVTDVRHELVAAASSSSISKAEQFLRECDAPPHARAYGSYADLATDGDVDIIYIATPHSHHYQNAMLLLESGKNVLCEKAFTVNSRQARALADKAKDKGLLLMEGMWTRYFPLSAYVRELVSSGRIGPVERVLSEHSLPYAGRFEDDNNIMVNPRLAGGILLDGGIYSLTWAFQALYSTQPAATRQPPTFKSMVAKYAPTGVDSMVTMMLEFPRDEEHGGPAHAVASCSMGLSNDAVATAADAVIPNIRIQGPQGELQVFPPAYRPTRTRLILKDGTCEDIAWPQPGPGAGSGWYNGWGSSRNPEGQGHGLFWEADDAARALVEGRKEGSCLGLDESILIMEIMDEVRRDAGLEYPAPLETTDYPVPL
ncbi:hypothetical protein B0J13DRAFT_477975 [Dactylonectria estremocensis]|uniref:D-xylose 1-dehydrogenase (NADP(+), D-xylono-1,5-lactone-forming) n=1 Tax=Dactylonectria estremocensis TaxID=1079267 RepID=A0A9P9EKY3_9HYPO|nr:hypothetical protein B0J13DRAFT_477975 [Dactylonectria estremocensis]